MKLIDRVKGRHAYGATCDDTYNVLRLLLAEHDFASQYQAVRDNPESCRATVEEANAQWTAAHRAVEEAE